MRIDTGFLKNDGLLEFSAALGGKFALAAKKAAQEMGADFDEESEKVIISSDAGTEFGTLTSPPRPVLLDKARCVAEKIREEMPND